MPITSNVYQFSSVSEMASNGTYLNEGDKVFTQGYYTAGDGGGAAYVVKNDIYIADGGSIISLGGGKVARLTPINGKVNVKQFGAKGDGLQDDTEALRNAIAFSEAKVVEFDKATYAISAGIPLTRSNFEIDGKGATIQYTVAYFMHNIFNNLYNANKNIVIRDIVIKGYDHTGSIEEKRGNIAVGIAMKGVTNIKIENVIIENCNPSVSLSKLPDGTENYDFNMKNCKLINCITGLSLSDVSGVTLRDSYIDAVWSQEGDPAANRDTSGIRFRENVNAVLVENCIFKNSAGQAIDRSAYYETLENPSENHTYKDIVVLDCYRAFKIGSSVKNIILSNIEAQNVDRGIYINSCENLTVENSNFNCNDLGVEFGAIFKNIVFDNVKVSCPDTIVTCMQTISDTLTNLECRHCSFKSRQASATGNNIKLPNGMKLARFFDCDFNFAGIDVDTKYYLSFVGSNPTSLRVELEDCRIHNNGLVVPKAAILYSAATNLKTSVKNCVLTGFDWIQRVDGDDNSLTKAGMITNYKNIMSFNNIYSTNTGFLKAEEYNV